MKWYPKIELLKKNELKLESLKPGGAQVGGKPATWKDMKDCIPLSNSLRALLPSQREFMANKRKR